jgi:hypothetical protein
MATTSEEYRLTKRVSVLTPEVWTHDTRFVYRLLKETKVEGQSDDRVNSFEHIKQFKREFMKKMSGKVCLMCVNNSTVIFRT